MKARGATRLSLWALAALLAWLPSWVNAQQFTFRQYNQQEGLSNLSVRCLLQDRAGYLWICTENGLFRHDGHQFKRVGANEGISDTDVHGAIEDDTGRLWVGTDRDLYVGDGAHFEPIRPAGRRLTIGSGTRMATGHGSVLVIDGEQLITVRPNADRSWQLQPYFSAAQLQATPALARLHSLYIDRQSRVWLGCGTGICRVDDGGVEQWDGRSALPADDWHAFLLDHEGTLWVRGLKHAAVLNVATNRFELRDPPHAELTSDILNVPMIEDQDGRILTRSDRGVVRWQHTYWQQIDTSNGLTDAVVSTLFMSRDGSVWIGTSSHGVFRWLGYRAFDSWTTTQGLGSNQVWAVLRDSPHSLLIGTRAGCFRLDETDRRATPCAFDGLPAGEIQVMAQRHDGSLWLGMTTGQLMRVAAGERRAQLIARIPLARKLFVDAQDRLWVGAKDGIHLSQPGSLQLQAAKPPSELGDVTDIAQDANGTVWFATENGLLRWQAGQWRLFSLNDDHAQAGFLSVTPAQNGWLWVSGTSHGLMHLHVRADQIDKAQWVSDPAVADAAVYLTARDARGWIWAGTDAGIAVFDGYTWHKFTQRDGLIWNDTDENAVLIDRDDSIWIGTSGGLTHVLQPTQLIVQSQLDLRLVSATLGSRPLTLDAPQRQKWTEHQDLSLHFADLDYAESQQTMLKVRLLGLSEDWYNTPDFDVRYLSLLPGQYTLQAELSAPDHGRSSRPFEMRIEILPPWWQTLWFRAALALAACALLALLWNWRMRQLEIQRRVLQRELKEREALLERATRDALTRLWNRTAILEVLEREIATARRTDGTLAIALIDIDHFKRVNDTHGHLGGDQVLRVLGTQLARKVRARDSLGRYGGEELLLVVPEAPPQRPFLPLERLRRAVAEIPIFYDGKSITVTASFGVAWLAPDDSTQSLLARADAALYAAKFAGRDRVEYAA